MTNSENSNNAAGGNEQIACSLYDYIEVACLRGYKVALRLVDGSVIEARARTTRIGTVDRCEYLVLDDRGSELEIPMNTIFQMTPMDEAAEFGSITFSVSP